MVNITTNVSKQIKADIEQILRHDENIYQFSKKAIVHYLKLRKMEREA